VPVLRERKDIYAPDVTTALSRAQEWFDQLSATVSPRRERPG
jgi:hypothetical protein